MLIHCMEKFVFDTIFEIKLSKSERLLHKIPWTTEQNARVEIPIVHYKEDD